MNTFLTGFSSVLSSLGANGILPIMLFLVAIIFRMKIGEAIRAALTGAVGMVGMNLVTNMLVAQMTPATQGMVERLGWHLDIVDTGWSLISYSWGSPVAGILILIGIGLNLVLLITNFTKTLMLRETRVDDIIKGNRLAVEIGGVMDLPVKYNTCEEHLLDELSAYCQTEKMEGEIFPIHLEMRDSWLDRKV